MKLMPGPFLVPSLALGAGALMLQAASSRDSTLIVIAVIGAAGSLGAAYLAHKGKKLGEETKVIATQTREMADGRLSKMVDTVDELTQKLAASESRVAGLVASEVGKASSEVLTRAQEVVAKAEATAASLLEKAEERAVARIAEARREADQPRRRR